MNPDQKAKRLRIYISSTDKLRHAPLYEVIIYAARRYGIEGATVFRGYMGYGASSHIHSPRFWELTEKVPVVIEIVGEPDKIDSFINSIIPWFEKTGKGHLITVDETSIVMHKAGKPK